MSSLPKNDLTLLVKTSTHTHTDSRAHTQTHTLTLSQFKGNGLIRHQTFLEYKK